MSLLKTVLEAILSIDGHIAFCRAKSRTPESTGRGLGFFLLLSVKSGEVNYPKLWFLHQ
jgi:hypothetical protein